ncbi:MAG: HAD family hydrolase [Rubrivivax sp.]|nr:HAD family hydrolase [Pyrinomonadaceae bacterium]
MLHPSLIGARACVFDAGGTLVHPDWPRLAAFAEEAAGRVLAPDEMRRAMGDVLKAVGEAMQKNPATPADERRRHWVFRRMYLALGVEESACEDIVARLDAAHVERHLWCGLDPEAPRVLEELKREGLRVAVISNTEDGRLRDSLEAAQIDNLFDLLIDSHLVGCRKPEEAIFRLALDELGVEADEAAFVGDSYAHDALAARAAGLRAILLDPLDLHPESVCPRIHGLGDLIRGGV